MNDISTALRILENLTNTITKKSDSNNNDSQYCSPGNTVRNESQQEYFGKTTTKER